MKSIFDLIDSTDELSSSNQGLAKLEYDSISPLRSVVDSNGVQKFSDGVITLRWHYSNAKWVMLSRSYIKMIIEIKQGTNGTDNDPLLLTDGIAVAMGLPHGLFSQCSFLISDKVVDVITNNYAQVSSYNIRQNRSKTWLDTTGSNVGFWDSQFTDRNKMISSDGTMKELIHAHDVTAHDVYTQAETFAGSNLNIAADTLAVGAGDGVLTWVDGGGGFDVRLATHIEIGNIMLFRYENQAFYSAHRITAIDAGAGLTLTLDPPPRLTAIAANVLVNGLTDVRVVKDNSFLLGRRLRTLEVYFQPSLSVFDIPHALPGGSKIELQLLPYTQSVYQKCGIESLVDKTHITDFRFEVKELTLYNAVCQGPELQNRQFMLDLSVTRCQLLELTSAEPTQYSIDVSPSTNKIGIAFQDNRVLTDSRFLNTMFKVGDSKDLQNGLSDAYLRYSSLQLPNPEYSVSYNPSVALANNVPSHTDKQTEIFHRNTMYNGSFYDTSCETFQDWRERGLYLAFPIARTSTSRESRAYVKVGFQNLSVAQKAELVARGRLLIFDTYKKVAIVKMMNGKVYEVLLNDV